MGFIFQNSVWQSSPVDVIVLCKQMLSKLFANFKLIDLSTVDMTSLAYYKACLAYKNLLNMLED
jgi:hypothetical protein